MSVEYIAGLFSVWGVLFTVFVNASKRPIGVTIYNSAFITTVVFCFVDGPIASFFAAPFSQKASAAAATVIAPERSPPDPVVLAPVAISPPSRQLDPQWLRDNDRTTYGRYYAGPGFKPLDSRPQFVASQIRADGSDADGYKGQMSQFHLTLGK